MPAELLEHEAELSKLPGKVSEPAAVRRAAVNSGDQQTTNQGTADKKSIWREIFEGHEEMLGWTPD